LKKLNQTKNNKSYDALTSSIRSGDVENLYIFHGDERYLLDYSLKNLRVLLCPDGLNGFNYKYYEGKGLSIEELEDAVNTLPAFADKTMIEIHDFDIFKSDEKKLLCNVFSDLPDYVCIVFVYSFMEYKPDGREKLNKEILKYANVIEFNVQEQDKLVKWIKRHFMDTGKSISTNDAEYLAEVTGGLMTVLQGEIEKVAAFCTHETITRWDIDTVVSPVLDTVVYKLTDAVISGDNTRALLQLDELFQMREAPHKMLYSISLKMRQLLTARVCIENNLRGIILMDICGIKHEFQARTLLSTANKTTLSVCKSAVLLCSESAIELNSTADPESGITELVLKLAQRNQEL